MLDKINTLTRNVTNIIPNVIISVIISASIVLDTKYGKYVKLGIAMLTTFGLIGTGAHQAGFFDIESEPTSVV
jgi:hypothetical protein